MKVERCSASALLLENINHVDNVNKSITSTSNYQKSQTFLAIKIVLIRDPHLIYYCYYLDVLSANFRLFLQQKQPENKSATSKKYKKLLFFCFPVSLRTGYLISRCSPGNFEPFVISSSRFKETATSH